MNMGTNNQFHSARQVASFPGFPALDCEHVYTGRAWYLFSREDDVIKIGIEQKGKVLCIIQPPTLHSMLSLYDIHPPVARYVAAMVALFPVLSL